MRVSEAKIMDKKDKPNWVIIAVGAVIMIAGIILYVFGASRGPWYLMFIAMPLLPVGIALILLQVFKAFYKKQKAKGIRLLKEMKTELMDPEPQQQKILCNSCGTYNESSGKFCKQCGKPLYKVCPFCNAMLDDDDKFCKQCGKEITP